MSLEHTTWALLAPRSTDWANGPLDTNVLVMYQLTLEGITGEGGGGVGGRGKINPPSIFLALNFCSLTDYQKLWYNCFLFVKTSFDFNEVTSRLMTS